MVTMIAPQDDDGIVLQAIALEFIQHPADLPSAKLTAAKYAWRTCRAVASGMTWSPFGGQAAAKGGRSRSYENSGSR